MLQLWDLKKTLQSANYPMTKKYLIKFFGIFRERESQLSIKYKIEVKKRVTSNYTLCIILLFDPQK
jgi:hypothetical protein